jgi:UDP-N-acetylglucosamine acyltransferase
MNVIHATAIVHPSAILGQNNTIGPGVVIHENVIICDGNYFGPYVVIGEPGEYRNPPETREGLLEDDAGNPLSEFQSRPLILIGNRNRFSERVSVQMPVVKWRTVIGSDCMLMHGVHVAHDCRIGDHVTIAPGVILGGVVELGDRVNIGMNAAIHPRVKVGEGAMIGMVSCITHDVKEWTTVVHVNTVLGFNVKGMKKAGWSDEMIKQIVDKCVP